LITVFDFPGWLYADDSRNIQEAESRNGGVNAGGFLMGAADLVDRLWQ